MKPPSVPNRFILYFACLKLRAARCTLPLLDTVSEGWRDPSYKQLPRPLLVTYQGRHRLSLPTEKWAPTCCLPGALRG